MVKKILSITLCFALVLTSIGVEVFAAKSKGNVIYSQDFENYAEGTVITADKTSVTEFNSVTSKTGSTLISVESEKGRGKVLRFQSLTTDGSGSGPNVMKTINLGALTNLHIEYELKGYDSSTACSLTDGSNSVSLCSSKSQDWMKVEIDIDISNATYSVNAGGKVSEGKTFTMFPKPESISVRFTSSLKSGSSTYLDNVLFTTTDDITPEAAFLSTTPLNEKNKSGVAEAKESLKVEFDTSVPEPVKVPDGMNIVLYDDCESYGDVLTYDNWSLTGNKTYIMPAVISGNKVFKIYNSTPENHGPRFSHGISGLNVDTLYFECDVMSNKAAKFSTSLVKGGSKSASIAALGSGNDDGKWHKVKVVMDFKNASADCFVDGNKEKTYSLASIVGDDLWKDLELRINITSPENAEAYIDNTVVYTPDSLGEVVFDYKGNINWNAVKADNPTGMAAKTRESHPRIFTNDWEPIREKIKNDYWCGLWWKTVQDNCEQYIRDNVLIEYKLNERNNLNNTCLDLQIKLISLGFACGVTGDKRYADKGYEILKHAYDTWPDFGETTALISSNAIYAFAIGYDWLYNELTPEQREDLLNMMVNRCAYIAVEGYENRLSEAYHTMLVVGNNQTSSAVCANILMAISLATERPEIAEYIFENAAKGMPNVFPEIAPDGAYLETCEYWSNGVGQIFTAISALESAIKDGEKLPECLDWAGVTGLNNTGDFPIYYNGAKKSFNYGDSTSKFVSSPVFLYISARYKKPKYAWYELTETQMNTLYTTRFSPLAIIWYDSDYTVCKPGEFELDKFYSSPEPKSINGFSMRSSWETKDVLFAAMQGGDNSSMHMRPSLGTFVLDYAGERWFTLTGKDASVSTYTLDSQYDGTSSDLWHHRTESNNTLVINPDGSINQKGTALAPVVMTDSDANSAFGIIDYSDVRDDISSWKRGMMMFDKRTRVKLRDEIKMKVSSEIYWLGHTAAEIELTPDKTGAMMKIGDKRLYARLNEAPNGATFEVRDISPLPGSPNPEFQKGKYLPEYSGDKTLCVHMTGVTEGNIEVEFITLKDGEAVPSDTASKENLDSWKCEGGRAFVEQEIGNAVALKIDSPLTFAKGKKAYVDKDNKDVVPFIENDRTLVPVRFISESFGAEVGWDDATKTVDVKYLDKHITLQLGSAEMNVNGSVTTLDVCANVYNDRTFIPLRALSEALGKVVTWDNRGLIVISDTEMNYGAEALSDACEYLDIRVFAGGDEIEFSPSKTVYYVAGAKRDITFIQNHFAGNIEKKDDDVIVIDGTEYKFVFEN